LSLPELFLRATSPLGVPLDKNEGSVKA